MVKKIIAFLKESIGVISSIITIIVFFVGQSKYAFYLAMFSIAWVGVTIFVPVIQIFSVKRASRRIKIENDKSKRELNTKLHKFYHKLRDNTVAIDLNHTVSSTELRNTCEVLCASICEVMEQVCKGVMDGNQISTCVKSVNAKSIDDISYEGWEIETLGRSPSTDPERTGQDNDCVSLGNNSDFLVIVKGEANYVALKDMRNIYEDFRKTYRIEYKNSRGDEFINYYRSCIIIPIEIDGDKASKPIQEAIKGIKNKKLLLGFLCIDSMKVFETEEETVVFEIALEVAKAIGDSMYMFMEKVLLCQIQSQTNG